MALLLDIRSSKEYREGHIPGAINIPTDTPPLTPNKIRKLEDNLRNVISGLNKNHPIVLYCKRGIRSSLAYQILKKYKMTNVTNLGGIKPWEPYY